MGDVIDFKNAPVAKLQKQLEQAQTELDNYKKENERLRENNKKIGNALHQVTSVNDLLKLQLNDLISQVRILKHHLDGVEQNAAKLKSKLPNIKHPDQDK